MISRTCSYWDLFYLLHLSGKLFCGFFLYFKEEVEVLQQLTSCLYFLQVIPKPGRTNLSLETQTTWWVQTVCLCSLTTSEEGNSWPVTECDEQGTSVAPLPCSRRRGGVHNARWSMNLILSRCLLCPKFKKKYLKKKKGKKTQTQGESEESSIPKDALLFFISFFFGDFKACKK